MCRRADKLAHKLCYMRRVRCVFVLNIFVLCFKKLGCISTKVGWWPNRCLNVPEPCKCGACSVILGLIGRAIWPAPMKHPRVQTAPHIWPRLEHLLG